MLEVLRSNDLVLLSFAQAVLRQVGIVSVVADQYISVTEGSIGAFPRRLLVESEHGAPARRALSEAGLDDWLVDAGAARA
jgi:hypothetical protein